MHNNYSRLATPAKLLMLATAITLLSACSKSEQPAPAPTSQAPVVDAEALRPQVEADLHDYTRVLGSDEFGGRAPGTEGEALTVDYLIEQFEALGLEPGNGDSWVQKVPITAVNTNPAVVMHIKGTGYERDLVYGEDMMVSTQQQLEQVEVKDSQLVFVGYGISAPERGWDDYADMDVRGKTVVILINDPGYATQDPEVFNGNTMTYYGRWTYKYEEAARRGASGAIIVHQTKPAAYPWEVVSGSWSGPQIGLTAKNQNRDKVEAEAWMTEKAARDLFAAVGADFDQLTYAAARPGFQPVVLGNLEMSVTLENALASAESDNVVANLPGTKYPDEFIVYSAHWDHLGIKEGAPGDDKIFNGASDNASGTAGLLALARLHAEAGPAERSISFAAVTAEESGLLGAKWFVENPPYELATTVANLNMDNIYGGVDGRTRDVAVVGYGNSELDNYLAKAAERQGRVLVQEPNPEKGYYYRSDHFNFAKQGVPALYLTRGVDSFEHGKEWGQQQLDNYVANDYHKPSDEYSPDWDFSGSADNVLLFYDVANQLANSRDWPNWNPGTEFKSKRDETTGARVQL